MRLRAIHKVLYAVPLLAGACTNDSPPTGPGVEVAVAPLTLPGLDDACYRLTVKNGAAETVWQQEGVCADTYGDGKSAITYIGPCDASQSGEGGAVNTVTLELEDLFSDGSAIDRDTYQNPCGHADNGNDDGFPACELAFECLENQDTLVEFNLTVMRDANQGFFDIAVNFEDVFCSAKLDSCYDEATPIALLFGETGREHTAIAAVACTGGPGVSSQIVLAHPYVVCDLEGGQGEVVFDLELTSATGGNGTVTTSTEAGEYHLDYAAYFGAEQLDCAQGEGDPVSCGKVYYNLAINIAALAGQGPNEAAISDCRLYYGATASGTDDALFDRDGHLADPRGVYPWITFNGFDGAPLVANGSPLCFTHPMNGEGSIVTTAYMTGSAYGEATAGGFVASYVSQGDRAFPANVGDRVAPRPIDLEWSPIGTTARWACSKTGGGGCECSRPTSSGGTQTVIGTVVTTWWGAERCEFGRPNVQ